MTDRVPAPEPLRLVQTFANTFDPNEADDRAALTRWLLEQGVADPPASDAERAAGFRALVRRMLAHDGCVARDDEIRDAVNATSAAAPLVVQFRADGYIVLEPAHPAGIDAVLGRVIAAIFESMADGTWPRLKLCQAGDCQWAYYDASRNGSGHWCSMASCGNKAKARAYRERRRA